MQEMSVYRVVELQNIAIILLYTLFIHMLSSTHPKTKMKCARRKKKRNETKAGLASS